MNINVNYYEGNVITHLTPLVTSATWSGDTTLAHRHAQITLLNTLNGESKAVSVKNGNEIRIYSPAGELFRGIVFTTDTASNGTMTITAFDYNYYLTKNTDSQKFVNMKASDIVKDICGKYGIAYGQIDDTGYVIPKLILRNKTLYDMITIALTETRKKTGKVFLLTNESGKLVLRENKTQAVRLIISDRANLIRANYRESIEELRNSVRMTGAGGEDAKGVTVTDNESVKKYGLMRQKQHDGEKSDDELKPIANALLAQLNKVSRESNVEAFGDDRVIAGKMVHIEEFMTGIRGAFYVITDSHTYDANGLHTMSLQVSYELEVTEIEYEPPAEPKSETATTAGGNDVVSLARSFVGKLSYSFGGKNIAGGSGDCSGFTTYVYQKAAGINIGHGTSSQVAKGTKVTKSDAQPGDLVFFQGTYRGGVSHVGIVTTPGNFVSLASDGCKENSYTSGYWGDHYMQIRRVL